MIRYGKEEKETARSTGTSPQRRLSALAWSGSVRHALAGKSSSITKPNIVSALRECGHVGSPCSLLETAELLLAEFSGCGPLQPWVDDPLVTDVLVNGPGELWVERAGFLQQETSPFKGSHDVRALACQLASLAGRRLDDTSPSLDATLSNGMRVHALLPPLTQRGPTLSLRLPRSRRYTLDELEQSGMFDAQARDLLSAMVTARLNYLVSGATGSGKTTLLNALLGACGPRERIVAVEDATELDPDHPHVVRLQSRPPNVEGTGQVTLQQLVRHALRMRPDRLVVGECRGAEVVDLLAALNTGHSGGCATLHANSAKDVIPRLEILGSMAGLPRESMGSLVGSAIQAVIHVGREDQVRKIKEIALVSRETPLSHTVSQALVRAQGTWRRGPAWLEMQRALKTNELDQEPPPCTLQTTARLS